LASIQADPLTYAWYSAQKVVYYWAGHPSADWSALDYVGAWERLQYLATYLWAPVCFLAAMLLRFWRRLEEFLPYILLGLYFTAVHVVLWSELRLSLPLQPLLTVVLATALIQRAPRGLIDTGSLDLAPRVASGLERGFSGVTGRGEITQP
jgi:hypothetical protein